MEKTIESLHPYKPINMPQETKEKTNPTPQMCINFLKSNFCQINPEDGVDFNNKTLKLLFDIANKITDRMEKLEKINHPQDHENKELEKLMNNSRITEISDKITDKIFSFNQADIDMAKQIFFNTLHSENFKNTGNISETKIPDNILDDQNKIDYSNEKKMDKIKQYENSLLDNFAKTTMSHILSERYINASMYRELVEYKLAEENEKEIYNQIIDEFAKLLIVMSSYNNEINLNYKLKNSNA